MQGGRHVGVGPSGRHDSMGRIVPNPESQTEKLRFDVVIGNTWIK